MEYVVIGSIIIFILWRIFSKSRDKNKDVQPGGGGSNISKK